LHYFARYFFAPVLVSFCEEESKIEGSPQSVQVWVTNDLCRPLDATLEVALWSWTTQCPIRHWILPVQMEPFGNRCVSDILLLEKEFVGVFSRRDHFLFAQFSNTFSSTILNLNANFNGQEDGIVEKKLTQTSTESLKWLSNSAYYYFSPLKQVTLRKPTLDINVNSSVECENEFIISIESDVLAPFTFLRTEILGNFDDNAFMLFPHQKKQVTFYAWEEPSVSLAEFESRLIIETLQNSYN